MMWIYSKTATWRNCLKQTIAKQFDNSDKTKRNKVLLVFFSEDFPLAY